jgi:hypothetical protein
VRLLVLGLLLACSADKADPPDSTDSGVPAIDALSFGVDEAGPYRAGYRTWDIAYDPGLGTGDRTIRMNLWYPTEATSGEPAVYTLGAEEEDAFLDAPLAPSAYGGSYPVHAHSHGHQGWGATSAFLPVYMASHGWITVAPDHTGNTLLDNIDPKPTAIYIQRPLDVRQVLDALEADEILGPVADTSAVLLSGHSFGSYSTWAVGGAGLDVEAILARCDAGSTESGECTEAERTALASDLSDDRVVAILPMAGSYQEDWFGPDGYRDIQGPVLHMGGTMDDRGQAAQYDAMDGIDYAWLELEGGCHTTFSLGACPSLETELGFHIIGTYALAFGRAQVLGDSDSTVMGLLDGSIELAAEASYQRR